MTIAQLIVVLQVTLCVLAFVFVWRSWRQSRVTETMALFKATEDGESITSQLSFFKGETFEQKSKRINELFALGETRRQHNDDKFKAHLEKERAKQDGESKLKSV